jgi:hypothetical protein
MRALKLFIVLIALAAMALGAWWVGQGLGYIPLGEMANKIEWAYRGGIVFVVGAIVLLLTLRR